MNSLSRILRSTSVLWPYYLGIVVASLLTTAATLVAPFLVRDAIDLVVNAASDRAGHPDALRTVVWLSLGILATNMVGSLVHNIGGYIGDVMTARMREILSTRYFARLLALPQRYFDNQVTGTIIARLDRSITNVTQFLQGFSNNFFPMVLTILAVLGISAYYYWPLAILLLIIFPLYVWLTALTSKRWQAIERDKNKEIDEASGRFAEVVGQVGVVKSFISEVRELRGFGRRFAATIALTRTQSSWWHRMDALRSVSLDVVFFAIYLILFVQTLEGRFSIGVTVMLIQLVAMVRQPITMMSFLVDAAQRAVAGSRDYFKVMAELPEEHAPASLVAAASANSGDQSELIDEPGRPLAMDPAAPAIEFNDVVFGYTDDEIVIDGVSFQVAPGQKVALVGESGGGKSTLVNLLLGLYRPTNGCLLVGGHDTSKLSTRDLRASVGVVFQDASLFSGTIRENIAYGNPEATDEQIVAAAKRANADGFIRRFADGYDSKIGERGLRLSGGQKQRIAVARAILKDAPVLVLDEATSSLDTKAEQSVQRGLEELMSGRTTLIIAHRLSTISNVDLIVTLKQGHVDEVGSPAELATTGGVYSELLKLTASSSRADRKRLQQFGIEGV